MSRWSRDLHLSAGLFISPFVPVFALSVFLLTHPGRPTGGTSGAVERSVSDLPLPANLDQLSGRERIDALRPALDRAQVHGEVGWIQHLAKECRLVVPVIKRIDLNAWGLMRLLHTFTGVHPEDARNRRDWVLTSVWAWTMDAVAVGLILMVLSSLIIWCELPQERRWGVIVLALGFLSRGLFCIGLRCLY